MVDLIRPYQSFFYALNDRFRDGTCKLKYRFVAVFGQNNIFRISLERFARLHRIARSSRGNLLFIYSKTARRAVSNGTALAAWRSLCAEI